MSESKKAAQGSAAAAKAPKAPAQRTASEKVVHVVKIIVFFVTFGFAFHNILRDD